jgi:hypothetical protein
MDMCLSLNCFNVSIAAEGNCFVVYMYENVVQSSLNLRSEQRFLFYQPLPGKSSALYQLLQQFVQSVSEGEINLQLTGTTFSTPPVICEL